MITWWWRLSRTSSLLLLTALLFVGTTYWWFFAVTMTELKDVDLAEETKPLNDVSRPVVGHNIDVKGINVFYRESVPGTKDEKKKEESGDPKGAPVVQDPTVLLLHGMSFKSQNWEELGTMSKLASVGYRVIAIDLPGFGKTGGETLPEKTRGDFIKSFVDTLQLRKVVVVSPSMSGTFAVPFVLKNPQLVAGYVPVAPVIPTTTSLETIKLSPVPVLHMYGANDKNDFAKVSVKTLQQFPQSKTIKIPNAGHAAYMNQPDLFHKYLYNFLEWTRKSLTDSPPGVATL